MDKPPQIGIPTKLLKEFLNRKISVETNTGETFKGILDELEDNMSMSLSSVKAILADGRQAEMNAVYVKGTRIRLINLPDSAKDILATLNKPPSFRGRGGRGFRGGRGGRRGGGGGGKQFDRYRY